MSAESGGVKKLSVTRKGWKERDARNLEKGNDHQAGRHRRRETTMATMETAKVKHTSSIADTAQFLDYPNRLSDETAVEMQPSTAVTYAQRHSQLDFPSWILQARLSTFKTSTS